MADDSIEHGKRTCNKCWKLQPLNEFGTSERNPNKKKWTCKKCVLARQKEWGKQNAIRNSTITLVGKSFCRKCKEEKAPSEFGRLSASKFGINSICLACCREV